MPLFEFGCWCGVLALPWLWWTNGAVVSVDQFRMRTVLCLAIPVMAVAASIRRWVGDRRDKAKS